MVFHTAAFIHTIADVTPEFLSEALGNQVISFSHEKIGTGLIGDCYRIHLQYDSAQAAQLPASVVIKTASSNSDSRRTGMNAKLYERETRFYSEIALSLGGYCVAKHYHSFVDADEDAFDLVLEDISPSTSGDDLAGATVQQAQIALVELARLQAASMRMNDSNNLPAWVHEAPVPSQYIQQQMWSQFLDRYQDVVTPQQRQVCERYLACVESHWQQHNGLQAPKCLIHGDYRLDNMLFGYEHAREFVAVDWQTVSWGPMFQDVAYFLGCSLLPELRRAHTLDLLRAYHKALGPDPPFTIKECFEGVRHQSFLGLGRAFLSPMVLERTPRGDEMFSTMLSRLVSQIVDLGALDTLPSPCSPVPLRPEPQDEQSHPPGQDPLHSESWYFDVADPDQGLGLWIRLGVLPNQPGSWYTTLLCGPGRPTIAVVDYEVQVCGGGDDELTINTSQIKSTQTIISPLERYRVTLVGQGESFDDPAALLRRGERGKPVTVELDLTWHTVGVPYKWRLATRYEIPCTVSGTVKVDGAVVTTFTHAPGQRDHSWGPRDWWAADWVWTAFHLDDGTHIHGVEVRAPGRPRFGVGYVQGPGKSPIAELTRVVATEDVTDHHLVQSGTMRYSSFGMEDILLDIKPKGNAPLLLEAPQDGRISYFPRSWAEVQAQDGRKGVGWIEWNINEPLGR
jgi:hypothetical protein